MKGNELSSDISPEDITRALNDPGFLASLLAINGLSVEQFYQLPFNGSAINGPLPGRLDIDAETLRLRRFQTDHRCWQRKP